MRNLIRRKEKPVKIVARNTDLFVQTVYYRSNTHAVRNLLILLGLFFFVFFAVMAFSETGVFILLGVLFILGISLYLLLPKKSSPFTAIYSDTLIFEPDALQVGDEYFSLRDMEEIGFYIHSFYGLRYSRSRPIGKASYDDPMDGSYHSEFGDQNELHFQVFGKKYYCRFLLGSGRAWLAIYEIMQAWRKRGKDIRLGEQFAYDDVLREVMRFA